MLKFRCQCTCGSLLLLPEDDKRTRMCCPFSGAITRIEGATPLVEEDWQTCADAFDLKQMLAGRGSDRKSRLFASACMSRVRHLLPEAGRLILQVYEGFADGLADGREMAKAKRIARRFAARRFTAHLGERMSREQEALTGVASLIYGDPSVPMSCLGIGRRAAEWGGRWAVEVEKKAQCDLFRDIFGNPFRPVTLRPEWLAWNGLAAVRVAQAIYEERAFGDLPYLADALEDAGCDDQHILEHCREPGGHARGCWVVDAVLGRS